MAVMAVLGTVKLFLGVSPVLRVDQDKGRDLTSSDRCHLHVTRIGRLAIEIGQGVPDPAQTGCEFRAQANA